MSTRGWRAAGIIVAIAGTAALVALSRVPYTLERDGDAVIRLSWRTATAFVEECRTLTPEELARLPVHMRREQVCEGRLLPYTLHVEYDGVPVLERRVLGAGARQDRPLSVFEELRVPPGDHHVRVRWLPDASATAAAPPALELEATLRLAARDVALITYDGTLRRLVARVPPAP
jgi:hypothetical protein